MAKPGTDRVPRAATLTVEFQPARVGAARLVVLRGVLGAATVHVARAQLREVAEVGASDLVLDLGECEPADQTALGLLVWLHRVVSRTGQRLIVINATPRFDRMVRAARLHRIITWMPVATLTA